MELINWEFDYEEEEPHHLDGLFVHFKRTSDLNYDNKLHIEKVEKQDFIFIPYESIDFNY